MRRILDYLIFLLIRGLVGILLVLPIRYRLDFGGQVFVWIGLLHRRWKARVLANLSFVYPDMDPIRQRQIYVGVMRNFGRTLLEMFSAVEFRHQASGFKTCGPGLKEIEKALRQDRRVILVSGHFGNWEAIRGVLAQRGIGVAVLYKPMRNPYFDRFWKRKIEALGTPAFRSIRPFLSHIVRHGGVCAILNDQHAIGGLPLDFLGRTAMTQGLLARVSIRYDALYVPCYGIREPGCRFLVHFEKSIPNTVPDEMSQHFNNSLARIVKRYPDQWLWIHQRWKS